MSKNSFLRLAKREAIRLAMLRPQPPEKMEHLAAGRLPKKAFPHCYVKNCVRKVAALGLCKTHWQRIRNTGSINQERAINDKYGENNPKWRGGIVDDTHGRKLVYTPGHPNPSMFGSHVYRYRLVMEKHLGRFLLPSEVVHHKNGDVSDDRIENLEIMSQSLHAKLHNKNGRFVKCV